MRKKNVLIVFGTRPEAIKMAPLVRALKKEKKYFQVNICVTAQHREMLDQVLDVFEIKPDIDLNLMKPKQDLFDITTSVLNSMKTVLKSIKPDILLVHGDTTTAAASAMAAFYLNIRVAHVEAGLRTHDLKSPFPEEFNRQLISKLADIHFCPTDKSNQNLLDERVSQEKILVTGNTVIDALFWVLRKIDKDKNRSKNIAKHLESVLGLNPCSKPFILITGHRRENFGDGFEKICSGLKKLAVKHQNFNFIYPTHLNPNVQAPVNRILSNTENVYLTPPIDYEPFVYLLKNCYLVLTDSGGIQEEAPSIGKPVLVMRNLTEREEALSAGTVRLVGTDESEIFNQTTELIENKSVYKSMSEAHNPYGDGKACDRIVSKLKEK